MPVTQNYPKRKRINQSHARVNAPYFTLTLTLLLHLPVFTGAYPGGTFGGPGPPWSLKGRQKEEKEVKEERKENRGNEKEQKKRKEDKQREKIDRGKSTRREGRPFMCEVRPPVFVEIGRLILHSCFRRKECTKSCESPSKITFFFSNSQGAHP